MDKINNIAETSNHQQYLDRMTTSFSVSSKRLIPLYITGKKVLDVGCGSGVLMKELLSYRPNIDIMGIDINKKTVEYCIAQGLNVKCGTLDDLEEKFDTIIFSSVLHELSSYADDNLRFTVLPIINALQRAYQLLNPNGTIIIRDGLKGSEEYMTITAKSDKEINAFNKYMRENPIFCNPQYNVDGMFITTTEKIIKEFLFTYTWGEESYSRELNEQYGILTVDEWKKVVEYCKLTISATTISAEEYAKYLYASFSKKELDKIFAQSTIVLIARKYALE